ncbi:general substrate transporter [Thelephora ganbajun]|uniref:General substrate transporter n=1 Tax=Thelephora ganbajun TaxID=370292 RepID=A0ACB6ZHW3_THEGA|nr:general substrate transporter [Thelephora ganbajun]
MTTPEWTIADFIYRGPWWKNHGILVLNIYLVLPILTVTMYGLDASLVNGLQILPAWQEYVHDPNGKTLGLINCAQVIGSFLGMPFTPLVSDGLGRRSAIFIGSVIILGGVGFQVCATNVRMFIGARVIVGFGLSFALNAAPLLVAELAYPTQRGKLTSIYNSSWYVGSVTSAWICFGTWRNAGASPWSWRFPLLVQCVIPIGQLALIYFIPESPRWLVAQGREGEATRILCKYHANGSNEHDPLVVFEMAQIRHSVRMDREVDATTSWASLVSTPGNRKRMMIVIALAVFSQWSGNGLVSCYIHLILEGVGVKDPGIQGLINGSLQLFNLFAAMLGASLVDKLGRKTLFIISNLGMLINFAAWTLTTALFNNLHSEKEREAAAKATIPFIFLFFFFYALAYMPLLVAYTVEILPFKIRSRGFAVMSSTSCLVLAFNQFVNPWALDTIGWKYYLVYCGWLVFELVFVLTMIVETKGRTLEETAVLFDGDPVPQNICQQGGDAATVTVSRGIGTAFEEVEDRLRYLELNEKSPRKITMAEFYELKRTNSAASDPSTSEHIGRATSPPAREMPCNVHRDTEAQQ